MQTEICVSEELLEKHRDINVDYEGWAEPVTDDFKATMENVGFDIDETYWTGFWSQGDGACYTGSIGDMKLFMSLYFRDEAQYPVMRMLMGMDGDLSLTVGHQGNYYHSNSMTFTISSDNFYDLVEHTSEFHEQATDALDERLGYELMDFEEEVVEILKGFADKLYSDLQKEYEYQTDDEQVKEAIIANDLHKEEE